MRGRTLLLWMEAARRVGPLREHAARCEQIGRRFWRLRGLFQAMGRLVGTKFQGSRPRGKASLAMLGSSTTTTVVEGGGTTVRMARSPPRLALEPLLAGDTQEAACSNYRRAFEALPPSRAPVPRPPMTRAPLPKPPMPPVHAQPLVSSLVESLEAFLMSSSRETVTAVTPAALLSPLRLFTPLTASGSPPPLASEVEAALQRLNRASSRSSLRTLR